MKLNFYDTITKPLAPRKPLRPRTREASPNHALAPGAVLLMHRHHNRQALKDAVYNPGKHFLPELDGRVRKARAPRNVQSRGAATVRREHRLNDMQLDTNSLYQGSFDNTGRRAGPGPSASAAGNESFLAGSSAVTATRTIHTGDGGDHRESNQDNSIQDYMYQRNQNKAGFISTRAKTSNNDLFIKRPRKSVPAQTAVAPHNKDELTEVNNKMRVLSQHLEELSHTP